MFFLDICFLSLFQLIFHKHKRRFFFFIYLFIIENSFLFDNHDCLIDFTVLTEIFDYLNQEP